MGAALIWLWDKDASVWRKALCDSDGKLIISDADPFEIVQDTPEDLKHVPHGRVAGDGIYLPFAVDADGKLQIDIAALEHLNDIGDVTIAAIADGHFIIWSSGLGYWQNRLLAEGDIPAEIARDTEVTTAVSNHADVLDAHTRNYLEILRTGAYHLLAYPYTVTGVKALTASYIWVQQIVVPRAITIDYLAIDVTVLKDGTGCRLGIYENGTNCYPGDLLIDAGAVDVSTTGVKAAAAAQALTKGVYWVAVLAESNPTLVAHMLGPTCLGVVPTSFTSYYSSYWKSQAYGALPDPFPAGGTIAGGAHPTVLLKVASLD